MKNIKRKKLIILALVLAAAVALCAAFLFAPKSAKALNEPYATELTQVSEEIGEDSVTDEDDSEETVTDPEGGENMDDGSAESDGGKSFKWISIIIAACVFVFLVITVVIFVAINKRSTRNKYLGSLDDHYGDYSDNYNGDDSDYAFERLKADYEKYMYDNYDGDDDDDDFDDDFDDDDDDYLDD